MLYLPERRHDQIKEAILRRHTALLPSCRIQFPVIQKQCLNWIVASRTKEPFSATNRKRDGEWLSRSPACSCGRKLQRACRVRARQSPATAPDRSHGWQSRSVRTAGHWVRHGSKLAFPAYSAQANQHSLTHQKEKDKGQEKRGGLKPRLLGGRDRLTPRRDNCSSELQEKTGCIL